MKVLVLIVLAVLCCAAQTDSPETAPPFFCPMDPDIRSHAPGSCSKCGMALVLDLPHFVEYPVRVETNPAAIRPGEPAELRFEVLDPETGERQTKFEEVHERLFHLLWVSHDLELFGHEHPELDGDGLFRLTEVFPREGVYRLLADFFPMGGAPQMAPLTLTTAGFEGGVAESRPKLEPDLETKRGANLGISLRTEPAEPLATFQTLLFFELDDAEGLERFLGAWAHLLAASEDLIDLIHAHPTIADGGPSIQINLIFPRPGMYRLWVQVQKQGVVSTVPFTIRAGKLGL